LEIKQYIWDVVDSNSWLITEGDHGLLIDAVENDDLFRELVRLGDLHIVLTHSHFDHIIGLNRIREIKSDVTVTCTEKCSEYLGNIYRNMSATATVFMEFYNNGTNKGITIPPFVCKKAEEIFADKALISWYGHDLELRAVHGHSNDGLIAILDDTILFSGDSVLHIPTVTRFPTGSEKRFRFEDMPMLEEMRQIEMVYPGHGSTGNLNIMLMANHTAK